MEHQVLRKKYVNQSSTVEFSACVPRVCNTHIDDKSTPHCVNITRLFSSADQQTTHKRLRRRQIFGNFCPLVPPLPHPRQLHVNVITSHLVWSAQRGSLPCLASPVIEHVSADGQSCAGPVQGVPECATCAPVRSWIANRSSSAQACGTFCC